MLGIEHLESRQGCGPELREGDRAVEVTIGSSNWLGHVEEGVAAGTLGTVIHGIVALGALALQALVSLRSAIFLGFALRLERCLLGGRSRAPEPRIDLDFRRYLPFVADDFVGIDLAVVI